jgi:hypothetical protein
VTDLDTLRYPVGRFERLKAPLDRATRDGFISTIEQTPARFRSLVTGLTDARLDTPYRPGGWTIRQVVHHVPDSHMNAYIRMKWAMTEDTPAIKTYEEQLWAELLGRVPAADSRGTVPSRVPAPGVGLGGHRGSDRDVCLAL